MARLRIDLTLTAGEESVWSISTGEAEADDAETLIEKLISMALPEKERMAERRRVWREMDSPLRGVRTPRRDAHGLSRPALH